MLIQDIQGVENRLLIWKIEESLTYFDEKLLLKNPISHHKKKLEFLAARHLITQFMNPDLNLIHISPEGKPYFFGDKFFFSLSHSFPYVGLFYSNLEVVGFDLQIFDKKILNIKDKFSLEQERLCQNIHHLTTIWSIKEAIFKWWGKGAVDFKKQIQILSWEDNTAKVKFEHHYLKAPIILTVSFHYSEQFVYAIVQNLWPKELLLI